MLCKHKKVVFFTFALGLWMFSFSVKAQTMNVHLADTVVSFNVADITSITFEEEQVKAVDLGLSVLWADCNLGADAPEGYGDYFGWGETETKSYYSWSYYPYYVPTYTSSSKPTLPLEEYEGETVIPAPYDQLPCRRLPLKYDAANSILGGKWRMPTSQEQKALCDSCTWTWTTRNKVGGYEVKGPSGKSIFLPAGGFRHGNGIYFSGDWMGYYWSGTLNPNEGFSQYAYSLDFTDEYYEWFSDSRYYGQSVRPVRSKANVLIEKDNGEKISIPLNQIAKITIEDFSIDPDYYEAVDLGLSVKWAAVNVDIDQFDYAAPSREIAGGYYGWGDETGKNISEDENDYLSYAGQVSISGTEHDLIRKYWGDPWRLPTMEEVQELCSECTWTWTNVNDQPGYMVIGPSGKSIFLPAVGWRTGETLKNVGTHGYYWSGTNISSNYVYQLGFNQKYFWEYTYRYNGFQLRGVR